MTSIPDALTRREMVYGQPKRPVDYVALAKAYLEAGRPTDVFDCVLRIVDNQAAVDELVNAVRDSALERGDWFVLNRVHTMTPLSDAQWKQAFQVANSTGKTRFALKIAERLGDKAEVERLELELGIRRPDEPEEGDAPTEEPKAEAKADEAKAEEPKADEAKADDKADEAKADEAKADDKADEKADDGDAKTD